MMITKVRKVQLLLRPVVAVEARPVLARPLDEPVMQREYRVPAQDVVDEAEDDRVRQDRLKGGILKRDEAHVLPDLHGDESYTLMFRGM